MASRAENEEVPEYVIDLLRSDDPGKDVERFWAELRQWYFDPFTDSWFARWNRFVFPGTARFDKATFSGDASFEDAIFVQDASFQGATFSRDVTFEGVTFFGDASFKRTVFLRDVSFRGVTFSGDVSFEQAALAANTSFDGATFVAGASFASASFAWHASLQRVTFSQGVSFSGAEFSGVAWFDDASFSGDASFGEVAFGGRARFDRATVSGNLTFQEARFLGDTSFQGTAVSGNASFAAASFSKSCRFERIRISGWTLVDGAEFGGDASFKNADFVGDASFEAAVFKGVASFEAASFSGSTHFASSLIESFGHMGRRVHRRRVHRDVTFWRNASFERASFSGEAVFENVIFLEEASFERANFSGDAAFDNVTFAGNASFRKATILRFRLVRCVVGRSLLLGADVRPEGLVELVAVGEERRHRDTVPVGPASVALGPMPLGRVELRALNPSRFRFRDARDIERLSLASEVRWPGEESHSPRIADHNDLESATEGAPAATEVERIYRAMRKNFEGQADRVRAHGWYVAEMEIGRRYSSWRFRRWARSLYRVTSNYGLSPLRPVVILVISLLSSIVLFTHLRAACPRLAEGAASCAGWSTSTQVALRAVFLQGPPEGVLLMSLPAQAIWLALRVIGAAMLLFLGIAFRNQVAR